MWSANALDQMPVHFILCTERTGSSLLSAMLTMNPSLLVASEEPFALYFVKKYGRIQQWSTYDIESYVTDFYALFEKNSALYFTDPPVFKARLLEHQSILTYERVIKLSYLSFYDDAVKEKKSIRVLVDKQMKYVFHKDEVLSLFPTAKIIVLARDVLNNIEAKSRRKIDFFTHPYYQAQIWRMTYERALTFPSPKCITFERLIENTEAQLHEINAYLEVEYSAKQGAYQEGFRALIEHRSSYLTPEYKESLMNFHSGILAKGMHGKTQHEINPRHLAVILNQTNLLRIKLGYQGITNSEALSVGAWMQWQYFGMIAYLFRPFLWRTYRKIPLAFKLMLRSKKGPKNP